MLESGLVQNGTAPVYADDREKDTKTGCSYILRYVCYNYAVTW